MAQILTARQAVDLISDESFVLFGGSGGGHAVPEAIIDALAEKFRETQRPKNLTVASVVSVGDWDTTGFSRFTEPGLVKRVVTAGLNNCPLLGELAARDLIEAYVLPQGVLSQLCRDTAAGRPGLLTHIGLHTFVDPRYEGGRLSPRTTEELVRVVELEGSEFLFYPAMPVDVAVVRGTTADERGNITMEEEAFFGEPLSMAAAARRRGGIVIAQVKRTAKAGTLPGKAVKVPGALVDYVVVDPNQKQTYQVDYDPSYAGEVRTPMASLPRLPFDIRKCIARRGAMELRPKDIVNLGYGVSNGISRIAAEEGIVEELTLTVEQGIYGGVPAGNKDAGAGHNYDALVDQPYQFDFYDGGGLDITFLSFGQVDAAGNVNVSKFGSTIGGPGGFINISQGTSRVVFSGTLTTKGLDIVPDGKDGLSLRREGRIRRWVAEVDQITFNGQEALRRGQEVTFITDRAVFELTREGLVCVEIAPGIDPDRDIKGQVEFPIVFHPNAKPMDRRIFREDPMGIAEEFLRRRPRRAASAEEAQS